MNKPSILWSIKPPEGKKSWLFGTMHIRDERAYQFCSALYPLMLHSDVYVGEMNLNPVDDLSLGPKYEMRDHFRLPVYFKLRIQLLKSFKLDIDRFVHLHPLMVMSAIAQSVLVNDHAISLDEHLWKYAEENQLKLEGLESAQEQLELLHSIDPVPIYKQIKDLGSSPNMIRRFTKKALQYYLAGEIHLLYHLTRSSMHQLRKKIIDQRNIQMVQRIAGFDSACSYFITVGAGHLSGKSGIISQLKKAGFKVRPVGMNAALKE